MASSQSVLELLLAALRAARFEVELWEEDGYLELLLTSGPGVDSRERYRVRAFDFEPIDADAEVGSIETVAARPPGPSKRARKAVPLTVAWVRELGLFVGWPAYDAREEWKRVRYPVPYRALREAAATGWAEPLTSSAAYAFRPAEVAAFFRAHRRVWRDRDRLLEPRRSAYGWAPLPGDPMEELYYREPPRASGKAVPPEPPPRPVVETGLSEPGLPGDSLPRQAALEPERRYLFWFSIGAGREGSIELEPRPLPDGVPEGSRLTVVLFPFAGELELEGPTRAQLTVSGDGDALVTKPAFVPEEAGEELLRRVLFFRFRTPPEAGTMRLRCSVYLGSTLLQSRLASCQVGDLDKVAPTALESRVDYALTDLFDGETLAKVPEHEFSLLANGGGLSAAPTHEFRFFGSGDRELQGTASLAEGEIKKVIEATRGALREASWGNEEEWRNDDEWRKKAPYRYGTSPGDPDRFREDVVELAIRGRSLYTNLATDLAHDVSGGQAALAAAVRRPGRFQIASARGALYLPAGLLYDHPLEASPRGAKGEMTICDAFLGAAAATAPLESSACFRGDCPNYKDPMVVCPAGFWGFRHQIGWPVGGAEPITEVEFDGAGPEIAIGVSTDPRLVYREQHIPEVLGLGSGSVAESREEFVALARRLASHLVYFYCHGGREGTEPFLLLGPATSKGLDRTYLHNEAVRWAKPPRPLVFINGCETTKLDPESLGGLVAGFVKEANAVGVVGTEITIFEQLACRFGLLALRGFLDERLSIGAAIRHARLELLRERNPLGLVYVPFVAADVRLTRRSR